MARSTATTPARAGARPCRVAFVGAGNMAEQHARAFAAAPGVELTGVVSRSRDRATTFAQKFGVRVVCDSIAELYATTRADLVIIAVSELSVREVAAQSFAFPWACLIEKPAGYDLADAEAIAATARSSETRAFVALNRRHYSSTRAVLDDLNTESGSRFIHVQDQEDAAAALKAGKPRLVVDNWMYANSIHLIDYFGVIGRGSVTSVERVARWNPANPGIVLAKIAFDSGDIGLYEAVWNRPGPWAVSVTTARKRWEIRPLEQAASQAYGARRLEPIAPHEWDIEFKPGLRRQAELAVCAARGEVVRELPTLDDALASMRLTSAIYAATE